MLSAIGDDLKTIGVEFDVWFREKLLFENGEYEIAMGLLNANGYTVKRDGAIWFTSSSLGDDKDNVLVRRTGQPTYFASDVAYHYNKFVTRGFDGVIDIWGADHQGHVARMKGALQVIGINPDMLTVLISQLVTLKRGGQVVRASKRTGELVTLRELVDEVGADACRYFFLARAAESHMEFDMELAKQQSADNPVYYVQYAYARIAGILRQALERGFVWHDGDTSALIDESELALLRKMVQLPELIDSIAVTLAPHALAHYATDLASAFHWFYDHCRVLSDAPEHQRLVSARLKLCAASGIVLARTLGIIGVTAPEHM
jgi:arginyl-tRNA synthetase